MGALQVKIVFIARHQDTTLVNDLEGLLVVEDFMEVRIGLTLTMSPKPELVVREAYMN